MPLEWHGHAIPRRKQHSPSCSHSGRDDPIVLRKELVTLNKKKNIISDILKIKLILLFFSMENRNIFETLENHKWAYKDYLLAFSETWLFVSFKSKRKRHIWAVAVGLRSAPSPIIWRSKIKNVSSTSVPLLRRCRSGGGGALPPLPQSTIFFFHISPPLPSPALIRGLWFGYPRAVRGHVSAGQS